MASISRSLLMPAPFARSFAVAALMGATMLASPWSAARADTIGNAVTQLAQAAAPSAAPAPESQGTMSSTQDKAEAAAGATQGKSETVDERITSLHSALKITPAEETKWNAVAQAMRENAAAIDKLATEAQAKPPQSTTAVEDLKLYQKFAEAHTNGLRNLLSSFTSLYNAMPEAQKKTTDSVFAASREVHQQASGAHS
jgi:protein CpxP